MKSPGELHGSVNRALSLAPEPEPKLIDDMLEMLSSAPDDEWLTAQDLCELLNIPFNESNRRRLRAAAEDEDRIGSGQCGYKLIERMTIAEWDRCKNWQRSQARKMIGRTLRQAKHRKAKAEQPNLPI